MPGITPPAGGSGSVDLSGYVQKANNLSDLTNAATGRTNLGAAQTLARTAVKTAAYTAAGGDFVPVDTTSGAVTVTLPTAPANGTRIGVKLVTQGGTNAVTIAAGGSDVFNKTAGPTTATLSLVNHAAILSYDTGIWTVQSADVPLSGLDARYPLVANNLSDVTAATARTNLGLGTAATTAATAYATAVHTHPATDLTGTPSGDLTGSGTTWSAPVVGDLAISVRKLSDLARTGGWLPTGWKGHNASRGGSFVATLAPTGGTLYAVGGCVLPGGQPVTTVNFAGAAAAVGPTHQWAAIVGTDLTLLATCVDKTSTAWSINAVQTFSVATTLGGATPGTYTPVNAIEVYFCLCQTATTSTATLRVPTADGAAATPKGLSPAFVGTSNTALTDPASLVTALSAGKIAALTAITQAPYCGWS